MLNSERYKTAAERAEAFYDFCLSFKGCKGCPIKGQCKTAIVGPLYWLDLEAEEEKPLPCPFCGGEMAEPYLTASGRYVIRCETEGCGYSFSAKKTADEFIAAHNLLARAVADAKEKEACE